MSDQLSIHGPILANTLAHLAGALIFGVLLYLFLVDWYRSRRSRSRLSALACGLALIWNLGSVIAISCSTRGSELAEPIITTSFSALILLPAVLLHISLNGRYRWILFSGYVLSAASVILHVVTSSSAPGGLHRDAILLVTFGFAVLSCMTVGLEIRDSGHAAGSRLAVAMALLLFAISFVHLGEVHPTSAWPLEILVHHAGLPLALFVLLHDYRFLLLDAFLRLVVNGILASVTIGGLIALAGKLHAFTSNPLDPPVAALTFVAGCLLLIGFNYIRLRVQRVVTRTVFLRSNIVTIENLLRVRAGSFSTESAYLGFCCAQIADYVATDDFSIKESVPSQFVDLRSPLALLERSQRQFLESAQWTQAIVPFRFSRGDRQYLLLGERHGRRPYLSEDLAILARLSSVVVEVVEQFRNMELQKLATQAELRALQAQINPHFLFNSLNTLYGTISRDEPEARRLVLNLAQVLRYFLQSDRTFIPVEEEMKIVRAYLEIEQLRLGPKLQTRLEVDPDALLMDVPVLSIQPLVENAIKHGVARSSESGFVHLKIATAGSSLRVDITNSGQFLPEEPSGNDGGVGLSNVKRRLELCYGTDSEVVVRSDHAQTTIGFRIPIRRPLPLARPAELAGP